MLFETETKWTYDEFKKMNRAMLKKRYIRKIVLVIILLLVMLYLEANLYSTYKRIGFTPGRVAFIVGSMLVFLIICVLSYLRVHNSIKKAYFSNKRIQDATTHFSFYEDRIEINGCLGNSVIKYDELYKVIETKENFYLCVATNQASNIIKRNCSEELITFLREKASKIG